MLFFRHDIIYQQLTTGWEQEEAPPVLDEEPRQYGTPVVRRPDVFYSDVNNPVPDEVAVIESGWDQAFLPALVLPRKIPPSTSVGDLSEPVVIVEDPGWDQAPPPPVVRRPDVFYSDLNNPVPDEIPLIETGWDQPAPPIVLRPPVFFPRTEEVLDEIPVIESGWDQPAPPIVLRPPVFFPRTEEVLDEIAVIESGWEQAFLPPLVPARKIPPSTSVGDLFEPVGVVEDPGWDQAFLPPLVRRIAVHYVDLSNPVPDEIAVIESGWDQAFLPPLVFPRDQLFFLPSENNPVMGATTVELTYTLDAILGPLAPPGLRLKELRLKQLRLKELRTRFIRRD